jgi:uncharacterized protein (TIGR03086 family)
MLTTDNTEIRRLFGRAQFAFGVRVHGIADDQWAAATPCGNWDVRTLVNHVLAEVRRAVPMLAGRRIEETGDHDDGDLLGDHQVDRWDEAAAEALEAVDEYGAMERTVYLSSGEFHGRDYIMQLFADLLIHAWDLSVATGQDTRLDPDLVAACTAWFVPMSDGYRTVGAVAARVELADDADAQARLLAEFGRAVAADGNDAN